MVVDDGAAAGVGAPNNDVDGAAGAGALPNAAGAGVVVDPNSPPPAVGAGAGVVDPKRPPDGAGANDFIENKRIGCIVIRNNNDKNHSQQIIFS